MGPSNLITLLESIPPYWEADRKMFYAAHGRSDHAGRQGAVGAPIAAEFGSDKIKTPLMVVQGANDPRVNKAEADQIVIALRDRGFPGGIPGGAG